MLFDMFAVGDCISRLSYSGELALECDSYNGDVKGIVSFMESLTHSSKPRICMTRVASDQKRTLSATKISSSKSNTHFPHIGRLSVLLFSA